MRLTELTLENYGSYDRRTLIIPESAGLTVVYGPNEAGKSTCLEAISDFLYTIPKNSSRGQFGYEGMRLSASMRTLDGQMLSLKRRKGIGKTLIDDAGAPHDETILAPILGAITRDRFETLFGLNHESLRGGGERLLHADGDIGRLIVEAGGGLRSLMSRLDAIDAETDKLFDTRRSSSRIFYQALAAYEAAEKTVRLGQLSRETYEQTRKAADLSTALLENLRKERRALIATTAGIERVVRVVPHLRELDRLTSEQEAYSDIEGYPDRWAERVREAVVGQTNAQAALAATIERRERLQVRIANLLVTQALTDAEGVLRALNERAILVSGARTNRANRQREIDEGEAQLAALRRILGLAADADLSAKLPDQAAIERVRGLSSEAIERRPKLANAEQRVDELAATLVSLEQRLSDAAASGLERPLDFVSSQFSSVVAQRAALEARERSALQNAEKLEANLAALGYESAAALRALVCPSPDAVRTEQAARDALRTERVEHDRIKRQAVGEIATATEEISALQAAGTVATASAIAAARSVRDQAWAPIRSAFIDGSVIGASADRQQDADAFDTRAIEADALADRRAQEAERAASLGLAERRIAAARSAQVAAEGEAAAVEFRLKAREVAFEQSFSAALSHYPVLAGLLAFSEQRDQVLRQAEAAQAQQDEIAVDAAQVAPTVELVSQAEARLALSASPSFALRVQTLQSALTRHEQGHADFLRDRREEQALQGQLQLARDELDRLKTEQREWQAGWPAAIEALGMAAGSDPAGAGQLVTEWAGARGVLGAIAQTRHRLKRMDQDEQQLANDVTEAAKSLQIDVPDDCVAAAKMLMARWDGNEVVRVQRDGLLPDFEDAKLEAQYAERALKDAQDEVDRLAAAVGVASDHETLLGAAKRYDENARLAGDIAQTEQTVIDVGEQLDIAALRAEWAERDLDTLRGALEDARARSADIENEIEAGVRAEKSAQDALAGYLAETQVNRAVAEREGASAQMHLALERYLELTVARELVSAAMARIRAEQQDPLIRRAATLFMTTTRGEFSDIETDIDAKGQPVVVGRRANGGTVSVATMSDGTRDQLFLAFRLASLEHYGAATEPLPFVADDVLVHFDDDRSQATLNLLAEFGKHNQVLLFTHHRSVRELAEPLVSAGTANIVELERAA